MKDHWTIEEYREYLRTGREPGLRSAAESEALRKLTELQAEALRAAAVAAGLEQEGRKPEPEKRRNKYGNQRTEVNGLKFDSRHEAEVYQGLMLRVRAGELKCVCRQIGFDLPGNIRYFADFVVIYPDNRIEVLDAKSDITRKNRVYINKKKQMADVWGLEIIEV